MAAGASEAGATEAGATEAGASLAGATLAGSADGLAVPLEQADRTMTAVPAMASHRPADESSREFLLYAGIWCALTRDHVGRLVSAPLGVIDGRSALVSEGWNEDRQDQQQAQGDALDLHRHAGQPERVLHDRDREHGENGSRDGSDPPKMLAPPSSTTVAAVMVIPAPASARALDRRDVRTTPAKAEMIPDRTNRLVRRRVTGRPSSAPSRHSGRWRRSGARSMCGGARSQARGRTRGR